jgi:hypothetical protein
MTSINHVPETGLAALWGTTWDFCVAGTAIPDGYNGPLGLAVSGAARSTSAWRSHV